MAHHVEDARRNLVLRQGKEKFGIDGRDLRTHEFVAAAGLNVAVGNHHTNRLFAARCRNRKHRRHRHSRLRHGLTAEEVPDVAVVNGTCRRSLGRINDAAAADSKHRLNVFCLDHLDHLTHQINGGIGPNATLGDHSHAFFFKTFRHATNQT